MTNLKNLRGMVDLLPAQSRGWQKVESIALKHFSRAGLQEIRTPIIEQTELFLRGIGENTDVVGKEMYNFQDRGGRLCTLRPEGTASVARSIVQHGLLNNGPQRLWYRGPMFRYERPQAGRQRQFHQIGVEFVGLASVMSDAEVISIGWDFLKAVGLNDLTLELNSLGSNEDRNIFKEKLKDWLNQRFDLLDEDSQKRINVNPLRILDSKNNSTKELLYEAPSLSEFLSKESKTRFDCLQESLDNLNIPFKINTNLVRGLDYYSHTAFEITSDHLGSQATVCGGGRYDGLISELGGPKAPSIGWAIGMERLIILAGDKILHSESPDVYVIHRGANAEKLALNITCQLRSANLTVELDYSGSSFSKQFKRADKSMAKWAIVIGEEEVSKGQFSMKKLRDNENEVGISQYIFLREEIDQLIKKLID
ncbi:histidine--tRNA ligase [Prochlorococcus marinus]|uniref:Histidine--tRNA ligase n=1 Tax=Prochlorococcus marinus XMU1408 TaxID=2213228 RepID=A0A318RG16_PROMR|nr:histidine--tRNA ligase [Prochlorococcus marinus]MBW3041650.1 histidine--tRNA ligase [Prochlorococcus marinus str. XMU1408]PYE02803.1 histidine--tRNA ligase [Prochlorococcus marinus XMU1408]